MAQGQSIDQLNPVKSQVSDPREQGSHQRLLCPGGTNLWSDSYKGLKQRPAWPPLAEEKTTQHLPHTQKLQPWTWLHSLPQLFRGAEGNTQVCPFITVRVLWCGRKASVPAVLGTEDPPWALKSTQGSSQQITDPEQNLASGEREFGRTRHCLGRGVRRHFQPTQQGHPGSVRAILKRSSEVGLI